MTKSTEFEKQISRIYKLLVAGSAEVTWNDKIPDPDNPKQLRQIDITIKRNDQITHVECRSHKSPQNTKWIEELYGRKISLKATAMMAVSDSGFTEGAILKAKKFGIFLRNLNELTKYEISNWGKTTIVSIHYYVLSNISFCFTFNSIQNISTKVIADELCNKNEYIDSLFNTLKYRFNSQRDIQFPYCFRLGMQAHNMSLSEEIVQGASVQGEVDELIYKFDCPFVYEYRSKDHGSNIAIAKVEKSNDIDAEVIKSSNGLSSIHFDLSSSPQTPTNSILSGIFKFSSIPSSREAPPKFTIIGSHEQKVFLDGAKFSIIPKNE